MSDDEDSELSELPAASPLRKMCPMTIDLARRIDPLLASLRVEKGHAELAFTVARGELGMLHIDRSLAIIDLHDLTRQLGFLENENAFADFRFSMKRGELGLFHVKRSFKLNA